MIDRIVILTEASFEKGFGHYYRMSTICDAAQKAGVQCRMIIDGDESAKRNLRRNSVFFEKWQSGDYDISSLIAKNDIVIVDSYNVTLEMLECILCLSGEMVVIDDNIRLDYHDMCILNPNYFAVSLDYPDNKGNRYYLGKDYTLLREAFDAQNDKVVNSKVSNILITLGGTDVKGKTIHYIEAIKRIDKNVKLNVVITSAYKNKDDIKNKLNDRDSLFVDASQTVMSDLMKTSDFAISAAGGTSNELIKMQCPALVYVAAENQKNNAEYLAKAGCVDLVLDQDSEDDIIRKMFDYTERMRIVSNMKKYASDKNAASFVMNKIEENKCKNR